MKPHFKSTGRSTVLAGAAISIAVVALTAVPAAADPSTGRIRQLDCGEAGQFTVDLGPAEFQTTTTAAIHVVDSTAVLNPRQVTVTFPDGSSAVTLGKRVKGTEISCSYTDPAGLFVEFSGTLT